MGRCEMGVVREVWAWPGVPWVCLGVFRCDVCVARCDVGVVKLANRPGWRSWGGSRWAGAVPRCDVGVARDVGVAKVP